MRQPSSQRHREHGYLPKTNTRSGGGAGSKHPEQEVVVNGRGNDSSGDSVGSMGHRGRQSPHSLEMEMKAPHMGQAANPNRAEMPRRTSFDPVSLFSYIQQYFPCYTDDTLPVCKIDSSIFRLGGDRPCTLILPMHYQMDLPMHTPNQRGIAALLYITNTISLCSGYLRF